ncbi:MAG: DUF1559 domain-containing protein [Phycisphaerae bacterium]|nr:DUF1559 domain-containing protein [Phycisphaerae bacterium]
MRDSKSFTLIELLVVVAIIAVLVSMLLPALSTARAEAQRIACLGQMRQVGLGLQNYMTDTSGRYPAAFVDHWQRWYHALLPYMGYGSYDPTSAADQEAWDFDRVVPEILKCPGREGYGFRYNSMYYGPNSSAPYGQMLYGFGRLGAGGASGYQGYSASDSDFGAAGAHTGFSTSHWVVAFESTSPGNCGSFHCWNTCHRTGSNVLLADGSATFWPIDIPDELAAEFHALQGGWWWYWGNWPGYQLRFAAPGYYLPPL